MSVSSGMRRTLPERRRLMLPLKAAGFARNSAIIVRLISRREPFGVTPLAMRHSVSLRATVYSPAIGVPEADAEATGA